MHGHIAQQPLLKRRAIGQHVVSGRFFPIGKRAFAPGVAEADKTHRNNQQNHSVYILRGYVHACRIRRRLSFGV
jgi:hypothetical protein